MFNNVFISYASEDFIKAKELFDVLSANKYDVWLDREKLLPGHDFNLEIKRGLKKADFVILLFSEMSVTKRSYVQREFKMAMEYCDEKLSSDIYLIPCKLDNCAIPDELSRYQWVELDSEGAFLSILNALQSQRNKYIRDLQLKAGHNSSFEYIECQVNEAIGEAIENKAIYPKFISKNNNDLQILNSFIEYEVYKKRNDFNCILGLYRDKTLSESPMGRIYSIDLSYKIEIHNKDYVSVAIFVSSFTGGAYGHYTTCGYNFKLAPLIQISVSMLFDNKEEVLQSLIQLCKDKILKRLIRNSEAVKKEQWFLSPDPIPDSWSTFDNFYLTRNSIIIFWAPFQINVIGGHEGLEVELSYKELFDMHSDLPTLARVRQSLVGSS